MSEHSTTRTASLHLPLDQIDALRALLNNELEYVSVSSGTQPLVYYKDGCSERSRLKRYRNSGVAGLKLSQLNHFRLDYYGVLTRGGTIPASGFKANRDIIKALQSSIDHLAKRLDYVEKCLVESGFMEDVIQLNKEPSK